MRMSLHELKTYCSSRNYRTYTVKLGVPHFMGGAFCVYHSGDGVRFLKANGDSLDINGVVYAELIQGNSSSVISLICNHFLVEGDKVGSIQKTYEVIAR